MLSDGIVNPDRPVTFEMHGSPGDLPAEVATPLALVMTELLQNCVEHAFPAGTLAKGAGRVSICFERRFAKLRILVSDDGVGLPQGRTLESIANLGLQIARTLVESELGGTLDASPGGTGTCIELMIPLP